LLNQLEARFWNLCKVFWTYQKPDGHDFKKNVVMGGCKILRYYFLPFGLGTQKWTAKHSLFYIFANLFLFFYFGALENERL